MKPRSDAMKPYPQLHRFLSNHSRKKLLVATHAGCDIDAFAAAAALRPLFRKYRLSATIGVPDHLNADARHLAKHFSIPFTLNPDPAAFDAVLLIDLHSLHSLGSLRSPLLAAHLPLFLLDHHASKKKLLPASQSLVDSTAVSSTVLVHRILTAFGLSIDKTTAVLIAAGIVFDSAQFLQGNSEAFRIMADCLERARMPYPNLLALLAERKTLGERIAVLKAAQRVSLFRANDFLFAFTHVGYFDSSAANALVLLGADIAFAASEENSQTLVLARASNSFLRSARMHVGKDIMEKLPAFFKGQGGGHAGAASFTGAAKREAVLEKCRELCLAFLKRKGKVTLKKI